MLIRICCECKTILGAKDDGNGNGFKGYTHGYCDDCYEVTIKKIEEFKEEAK